MALNPTGNVGFDAAARAAEAARQAAMIGVLNQITADGIAITYFQAVISAGRTFGISTVNEETALLDLQRRRYTSPGGPLPFVLGSSVLGGSDVLV